MIECKCPHCNGRMPDWMKGAARGGYSNERRGIFKKFCPFEKKRTLHRETK